MNDISNNSWRHFTKLKENRSIDGKRITVKHGIVCRFMGVIVYFHTVQRKYRLILLTSRYETIYHLRYTRYKVTLQNNNHEGFDMLPCRISTMLRYTNRNYIFGIRYYMFGVPCNSANSIPIVPHVITYFDIISHGVNLIEWFTITLLVTLIKKWKKQSKFYISFILKNINLQWLA